ncbi:MAG TPA: SsrA-binding protein SmpB [Tepidisphaeraceae bacterium]|nr:SsrA-binding protein SmpB [Tepidisphaeraceae bacterium]
MSKPKFNPAPRIENRKAYHDYFIESKIECGIQLVGSEVKSLRMGLGQLNESFATIHNGQLMLHGCYIDPYKQASIVYNHQPRRDRRLLAHRREIKKLEEEIDKSGFTLIPLAIYFKDGRAKLELGVARGKKQHDKRASIREKEMNRELRNVMKK